MAYVFSTCSANSMLYLFNIYGSFVWALLFVLTVPDSAAGAWQSPMFLGVQIVYILIEKDFSFFFF